jgi:hypothetical protein
MSWVSWIPDTMNNAKLSIRIHVLDYLDVAVAWSVCNTCSVVLHYLVDFVEDLITIYYFI